MKIKEITEQYRRDFTAIFECEHCGSWFKANGYNDHYFHNMVIPSMKCKKCGKSTSGDYTQRQPKYAHEVIV